MLNTTAAWVGGLDGSCRVLDASALPQQRKRFIDSLDSFEDAHADRAFASPVIESLAASYAVVAELFNNTRGTLMDRRLEKAINRLIEIAGDNVQMRKQLARLRDCNERHAGILHGGEILARLLMEVRRIQAAAEHIEVQIRTYLKERSSWRLASDCASYAWIEESVFLEQDPQGQAVYWAKTVDRHGRAILGDHHEALDPTAHVLVIAPSLAIVEQLPASRSTTVSASAVICEYGVYTAPYGQEFIDLESDGYTDSLV